MKISGKKLLVMMGAFLVTLPVYGQPFVVKGKLSEVKEPIDVTLDYRGQTQQQVSTDGTFEFKGDSFPTGATLKTMPHHPTLTMKDAAYWKWWAKRQNLAAVRDIFLEGNVTIDGKKSLNDAIVGGSPEQNVYEDYRARLGQLNRSLESARKANATAKQLRQQIHDLKTGFVERNPDSYFSLDIVGRESAGDPATFELLLNSLSQRMRETERGKNLMTIAAGNKLNKVGKAAIDFTQSTADGTPVTLSSYKGKYVLVDFWASWCVPCRAENPNVLRAYNKFKSKNFEIIGVSIDDSKKEWIKAVKQDKLPWIQVSDLKGGNNSAALAYAIKGVPTNVLIDPNGMIIAKDLIGKTLEAGLAKYIK